MTVAIKSTSARKSLPNMFDCVGGSALTGMVVRYLHQLAIVDPQYFMTAKELMEGLNLREVELELAVLEIQARHPRLLIEQCMDDRFLYRLDLAVFDAIVKVLMASLNEEK